MSYDQSYVNPLSLRVQRRPLGQQPQGLYSVHPQSTMIAAFPLQPEKALMTEPTYFGAQLRTITGQQPLQLQLEQEARKERERERERGR